MYLDVSQRLVLQVSREQAVQWCEEIGAPYHEASAKQDLHVESAFLDAARAALQQVCSTSQDFTCWGIKNKTNKKTIHECLTCLFLMIKDTLLPTVQKTHIGKYRTFPVSLQTAEGNSRPLSVLRAAPFPVWEDILRKTSPLLMLTTEHTGAKTVTQQGKGATLVYHAGRRRNKLKWIFFSSFEDLQLMV